MFNKIVLYGDVMLDVFNFGVMKRLSPEGPHPLINSNSQKIYLGGAGHVAALLSNFSLACEFHTATGPDSHHQIVNDLLVKFRVQTNFYQQDKTTVKQRYIAEGNTILRVDDDGCFEDNISIELTANNNCIVSDYGKGFVTKELISKLVLNKNKIFADVKQSDPKIYEGCYLVKPNLREFNNFELDEGSEPNRALQLLSEFNIKYLWITKGNKGSVLYYLDELNLINKEFGVSSQEVVDVTGAGDVMLATLVSELSNSRDIVESCKVAHQMASIAVSRIGTNPLTAEDLAQARRTTSGEKVVFTNGCFDILHQGHLNLLKYCKSLGTKVVVGINSDKSVKKLKGHDRPINDQSFRKSLLEELGCVDEVVIFEEETPLNIIKKLNPSVLVKGDDYNLDQVIGANHVLQMGGEVKLFQRRNDTSTSDIIKKINAKKNNL